MHFPFIIFVHFFFVYKSGEKEFSSYFSLLLKTPIFFPFKNNYIFCILINKNNQFTCCLSGDIFYVYKQVIAELLKYEFYGPFEPSFS